MCPAWRKHSGNNSSVRAVKMQRMEEGRHQGVTGNLFCYCCSIHWSWGHFSMKWQSDKALQRGKAGSTRYCASEKSCAQLFWSGLSWARWRQSTGRICSSTHPKVFGLSPPFLAMSCSGHLTQSLLNGWPSNWFPTCRESWGVPPVHSSSHQWFQHLLILKVSSNAVVLLSICLEVDEPNITLILERFKPRRTQPVGWSQSRSPPSLSGVAISLHSLSCIDQKLKRKRGACRYTGSTQTKWDALLFLSFNQQETSEILTSKFWAWCPLVCSWAAKHSNVHKLVMHSQSLCTAMVPSSHFSSHCAFFSAVLVFEDRSYGFMENNLYSKDDAQVYVVMNSSAQQRGKIKVPCKITKTLCHWALENISPWRFPRIRSQGIKITAFM